MDNLDLKELIETKLDNLKEDIAKLDTRLEKQGELTLAERDETKASIVRIHARMDALEADLKTLKESPQKKKVLEIIKEKFWEWLVPFSILFLLWLLSSGTLTAFVTFLFSHSH